MLSLTRWSPSGYNEQIQARDAVKESQSGTILSNALLCSFLRFSTAYSKVVEEASASIAFEWIREHPPIPTVSIVCYREKPLNHVLTPQSGHALFPCSEVGSPCGSEHGIRRHRYLLNLGKRSTLPKALFDDPLCISKATARKRHMPNSFRGDRSVPEARAERRGVRSSLKPKGSNK